MTIRMKSTVDMKMTGTARSHARTDIAVRDVTAIIDEPAARGGTNMGLTPTETILSSLVGCTNVIASRIAHREGVRFEGLTVEAQAQFDRRGAALEEEIDLPFVAVTLAISVRTDATATQMETIRRDLGRFCPIAKMIRAAGTPPEETWSALPI